MRASWRFKALYERALHFGPDALEYRLPDGRIFEMAFNPVQGEGETAGVSVFGKDMRWATWRGALPTTSIIC
jgi:hypothetical protein